MTPEELTILFRKELLQVAFESQGTCLVSMHRKVDKSTGYISMMYQSKYWYMHGLSYKLSKGDFDLSLVVRHTCDNMICCNPNHLLLGTQLDNIRDRQERGRTAVGTAHGKSKFTEEEVLYIRKASISQRKLAEKFNVNRSTIQDIQNYRTYPNIRPASPTTLTLSNPIS